jgi:subtilisin-like proprotein convertase family protein
MIGCACGQCGFDREAFINGQAKWFIRQGRSKEGVRIWRLWVETKSPGHIAELKAKIEEMKR